MTSPKNSKMSGLHQQLLSDLKLQNSQRDPRDLGDTQPGNLNVSPLLSSCSDGPTTPPNMVLATCFLKIQQEFISTTPLKSCLTLTTSSLSSFKNQRLPLAKRNFPQFMLLRTTPLNTKKRCSFCNTSGTTWRRKLMPLRSPSSSKLLRQVELSQAACT